MQLVRALVVLVVGGKGLHIVQAEVALVVAGLVVGLAVVALAAAKLVAVVALAVAALVAVAKLVVAALAVAALAVAALAVAALVVVGLVLVKVGIGGLSGKICGRSGRERMLPGKRDNGSGLRMPLLVIKKPINVPGTLGTAPTNAAHIPLPGITGRLQGLVLASRYTGELLGRTWGC